MKKKLYISIPITGQESTIKERYNQSINYIINNDILKYYEIITPFDVSEFDNGNIPNDHDYAWYMGEDIKILLRCDAIFMCPGWNKSKGCKCEYETARIYSKEIFFEEYIK